MLITMTIGGRACPVFCGKRPNMILLQPVDENDLRGLENQIARMEQRCGGDFLFAAIPIQDWNRELSPWEAPAVFGKADFGSGAGETLNFILHRLLPELLREFSLSETLPVILGGYSLAGLFALWSGCQSDRFSAIAAASPSVWFPDWIAYAKTNRNHAEHVYLSLGDREARTKNPVMATVGTCIQTQLEILRESGIDCILEWNQGNHFQDPEKRTAAAFSWCMDKVLENPWIGQSTFC